MQEFDNELRQSLPFRTSEKSQENFEILNSFNDTELQWLNQCLDWAAYVVDSSGRRFGNVTSLKKRARAQPIPDRRHYLLNEIHNLSGTHVLEIGCFEGIHTASLCGFGAIVTAVDARLENVVKSIVRTNVLGFTPTILKWNVEESYFKEDVLYCDLCHHFGVLYHLKDPFLHLSYLAKFVKKAFFIDTHVTNLTNINSTYHFNGNEYNVERRTEFGMRDPYSGVYDHSNWVLLEDLVYVLEKLGFGHYNMIEDRDERNGRRVLIYVHK